MTLVNQSMDITIYLILKSHPQNLKAQTQTQPVLSNQGCFFNTILKMSWEKETMAFLF